MKSRINLYLANGLVITLAIAFSTFLFLAQMHSEALQLANTEQEQAIKTFWQILRRRGDDFRIVDGKLMAGEYLVNGNHELPDRIREIFGGTATIFMGDTVVSTNALTADGRRAVGTKLTGPAYAAIFRENRPYRGEAPILGFPYFTAYDPIRDKNDKTIGILYVGVKKTEFLASYNRLKLNMIAGIAVIELLFLAIGFALLRERNRYEDGIQEQLLFLQTLIDTIPNPIFYKDRGGRYLGYNQAFEESMGLKRDQLIGKTVYDVAPQELADKYNEMDEALFTNPGNQVYDSSVVYADGTRHDVIFTKATFTDKYGTVAGLVGVILDVTERKRAEDILAEREEFLSDIIDGIQDGISILDADLRIIRVNPVMERWVFGGLPLVGRKCHEAYHGRTEPCEQCPSLETLRTGKPSLKIFPMTEKGTERKSWLELHTFPLYDSKKSQVMGVIEYIRDITEHKRADDALIAAENKFRSLVEQSLTGIYIIQDGGFVYVNPKMAEIFGYTQDELTSGITHLDLTVEEDRPLAAENVRRRIAGEVQSVHYGFRGLRKDGTTINAEVYGSGTQFNGRPAIIGTLLDVTARKRAEDALMKSEERFHQIFAQNFDAIILFRIDDLSIIDANPKAEELTGFTRSELKRFTPTSILAPEDFRSLMGSMPIDDHSLGFQLDKGVCTRKDGSTTYVSIWSKIIMLRDRSAVYCSIRDITDKVRLQEEIRTTQAKLIHANKMTSLGMLASSIAHEINNPNSYISANTAMLADVWRDATPILRRRLDEHGDFPLGGLPFSEMEALAPRLFNGIAEGSRRINAIVTNMKDYVKHDGTSPDVEFDLNVAVQDAATILWHHIHKHSDNFSLSLADDLPPARGSRQQIEQVVINLITNALQALPDKNSGVSVETGFDRSAGALTIAVRDKGKGMSGKVLQRLTEPFFTTRSGDGGTGLGLYISASIIKEHKGALEFDSLPGRGTTATVRLPMAGRAF